ncbi:MAG: PQQ-like beta-propeller repeat protein [Acidobacteriota bacterium]|nr:PQQ-like beta-propeller repeat protein [Acidobacteriota bacterium]
MMTLKIFVCTLLAGGTLLSAQAQDWNQWRGPRRDGVVMSLVPPATWPERPTQVWKVPAGTGHASPIVAGDRVYLFSRVGEQEVLTAYAAASGKQVWRQGYDAPYQMNPAATTHGKGPKSTPMLDRGRIFTLGISGILSAFDQSTGKVAWRHDFVKEFSPSMPDFGASMSPIVDGDNVIAHVGGTSGAIIAFNRMTGARVWTWKGDGPGYASPIIATFASTRHLVTQTRSHLVGLSPVDGRELWRAPFTTDYDQNIITPVDAGGLLIYSGLSKPTIGARLVQEGGAWKLQEVWRNEDVPMYMSSPVASGGVLYGLTHRNRGQFFALDVATGKTLWTSPPRQGENAALTAATTVLIATTTEGELIVMPMSKQGHGVVRKYTLAESPIWAHPAFTAAGVLVKDAETLSFWTF